MFKHSVCVMEKEVNLTFANTRNSNFTKKSLSAKPKQVQHNTNKNHSKQIWNSSIKTDVDVLSYQFLDLLQYA